MERVNLFSPFYYKTHINETDLLKKVHLEAILNNYKALPSHSSDWNVHTSYGNNNLKLPFEIDWRYFKHIYKSYIDKFCLEYFSTNVKWEIQNDIWYNVYGKGQNGMVHNHIDSDFAAVHYLKFNPQIHSGTTFINPRSRELAYHKVTPRALLDKLNYDWVDHSFYYERYTPKVVEGDLIIFPASMDHLIRKNDSDELRVTIAFNLKIIG